MRCLLKVSAAQKKASAKCTETQNKTGAKKIQIPIFKLKDLIKSICIQLVHKSYENIPLKVSKIHTHYIKSLNFQVFAE